MALGYKTPQVFKICKGEQTKAKENKKLYKKVKNALGMRFVIDCLGLALKKKDAYSLMLLQN